MKKIIIFLFVLLAARAEAVQLTTIMIETRVQQEAMKYLEADLYSQDTTVALPVILIQTPYNKIAFENSFLNPDNNTYQIPLDYDKYHIVVMDWRGRFANENKATEGASRGEDGYDAVEWIASQNWCNGKVGTWGGSALGDVQFQTAFENPPHLVCAVPMIKEYQSNYEDYFYGGVLRYEHFESLQTLGFVLDPTVFTDHPTRDYVWTYIENNSEYSDRFHIPIMMITGWFDHFPSDIIDDFQRMIKNSGNDGKLIVGPWLHGSLGLAQQGQLSFPEAANYPRQEIKKFLDYYLHDIDNGYTDMPMFQYFQMGDNEWKSAESWPAENELKFYLYPGGGLHEAPISSMAMHITPDTLIYDPNNPTPTIGGERFPIGKPWIPIGPQDLSEAYLDNNDVVRYTSAKLDHDIEIMGEVKLILHVSTDRLDTDFGFRFCDVYPDGKSYIIRQGIRRLRLYKTLDRFSDITPGQIYEIEIKIDDIALTVKQGHKIQIIVSSSNFPHFDINLNNGQDSYGVGQAYVATNVIHFDSEYQSRLVLPVSYESDIEENEKKSSEPVASIMPNPSNGTAQLSIQGNAMSQTKYEIYDALGNSMQSGEIGATQQIGSTDWPTGVYYIKLNFGRKIETLKYIIIR